MKSESMQSRTIAPMVEATSEEKVPIGYHPNHDTIQPPSRPPIIPTTILTKKPEPRPLTTRLASQPAARPISRYHTKNITQNIKIYPPPRVAKSIPERAKIVIKPSKNFTQSIALPLYVTKKLYFPT